MCWERTGLSPLALNDSISTLPPHQKEKVNKLPSSARGASLPGKGGEAKDREYDILTDYLKNHSSAH